MPTVLDSHRLLTTQPNEVWTPDISKLPSPALGRKESSLIGNFIVKALVLTFDNNHVFAAHMIASYERLWPDHPFQFLVPYQEVVHPVFGHLKSQIHYVPSPPSIRETVKTLLQHAGSAEWIYWAIDDKYLVDLDANVANLCHLYTLSAPNSDVSGITFARARALCDPENISTQQSFTIHGERFLRRQNYHQIWLHQFLRADILWSLFERFPVSLTSAKSMDDLKDELSLPDHQKLFTIQNNAAVFGESASRGTMTRNCMRDMNSLPTFRRFIGSSEADCTGEIYIGKMNHVRRGKRFLRNLLASRPPKQ